MTSKINKKTLQPPFEAGSEESRRQYILRRVRGVPVPPYPALSRGEAPYDLIASWIQDSSISWAKAMRDDLHFLLRKSLNHINESISEVESWELGGLLALAARLRDKECGKIAASFMADSSSENLSSNFMSIFDKDGLYGKVGELMFKVIDMTSPKGDQALFEAGIKVALSAGEGASLLSGLARRSPLRAKEIAPGIIKHSYNESNQKALVYIIRLLREACWAKDDIMTLTKVRDMFMNEFPKYREFVANALVTIFPTWNGKLYARELREASLSSREFRNRANPGVCYWQSYSL